MKVLSFILCSMILVIIATENEQIENLRKELNEELSKLENISTKKEADSEVDDALMKHMLEDEIEKSTNKDDEEDHRTDDAFLKLLLGSDEEGSSEEDTDAALLDLMSTDQNGNEIFYKRASKDNGKGDKKEFVETCKDTRKDCAPYRYYCDEITFRKEMIRKCRKTCGFCKACIPDAEKWTKRCGKIAGHGYCKHKKYAQVLRKNCYESCGYCRANAPSLCQFDPKGCCWDQKTFVKHGCTKCEDKSYVRNMCKRIRKDECKGGNSPAKWMRENCSKTCGLCKTCHDYKNFDEDCKKWKKEGKCKYDWKVQEICPHTCNRCNKTKTEGAKSRLGNAIH